MKARRAKRPTKSGKATVRPRSRRPSSPVTLAIDVGGTGLKALLLDAKGNPLTERVRVETPRPATPKSVIAALLRLVGDLGKFDRVSVGFPGVVIDGTIHTAPNLDGHWDGVALAHILSVKLGCPVRVLNDAGVQGYGVIQGKGTEMVITLGTGMGAALYSDGHYVPNLELAHHPFRHGKTYEEYVGEKELEAVGKRRWNRHVARVIEMVDRIWNPRHIYVGGGNAKHLTAKLPKNVSVTDNVAGLLGGIALWEGAVARP